MGEKTYDRAIHDVGEFMSHPGPLETEMEQMSDESSPLNTPAEPEEADFAAEEIERLRRETPLIAAGKLHLNHAGASPPPRSVLSTVEDYWSLESVAGGYETAAVQVKQIEQVYRDLAGLVGGQPNEIALMANATDAFAAALSAFDFSPGSRIVTSRSDYVSNHLMFAVLRQRRGVQVEVVEDAPSGGIDVNALRGRLRRWRSQGGKAGLVSLSWMPTNSGLVQPAAAVGAVCREFEVPYLIDACQVVGQLPVDVARLGCDFLSATGRKFLRGPRGTGFLWVAPRMLEAGRHPLALDLLGAQWIGPEQYRLRGDARRFESWEHSFALVCGLGAAAAYAQSVGVHRIALRSARLAVRLRSALADVPGCRVVDRGAELGAIVSLALANAEAGSAQRVMQGLRDRGVHTSVTDRSSALFEFDRLGLKETLRLSPHYVNTEQEIDQAVAQVAALL
jgi:selenocysteine lyase/cysteine desulfurase